MFFLLVNYIGMISNIILHVRELITCAWVQGIHYVTPTVKHHLKYNQHSCERQV